MLDVIVLTDGRYLSRDTAPDDVPDWYLDQVLTEDGLVVEALRARGLSVERRAWDDPAVLSSRPRALLFRTTWDYFDRWDEFAPWLRKAEAHAMLINEAALVHWNLDKHYLFDLEGRGVPVVPTRWIRRGSGTALEALLAETGWAEAVVKPAISGAGRDTFRVRAGVEDVRFAALVAAEDVLVQPFVPRILTEGEVSLVVLDGQVTHAVRKRAAPGEFRVQDDHGGTVHAHSPTEAEIDVARAAVAACSPAPLYARVDLVHTEDGPQVMELELVEPELFFRFAPSAADRLAAGVVQRLQASRSSQA